MAIQPILGGGMLPIAYGNAAAPRGNADIAVAQVAAQAQSRTLQNESERSAENALDTLNDFDSSATYNMHARVESPTHQRRRRGRLLDERI